MFLSKKSNGCDISPIRSGKRGFLMVEAVLSLSLAIVLVLGIGKICSNSAFLFGQTVKRNLLVNRAVNCCESDDLSQEGDFSCQKERSLILPAESFKDKIRQILGAECSHLPECEVNIVEVKSKDGKSSIRLYVFGG